MDDQWLLDSPKYIGLNLLYLREVRSAGGHDYFVLLYLIQDETLRGRRTDIQAGGYRLLTLLLFPNGVKAT